MAIDINIGSKLDAKGFKQAETSLNKLNNQSKSLAKNFGRALSAAAVLSFSRASIKAYAEDQKAATSLSKTLDNLGIGFGNAGLMVNDYISKLEKQTGVLDDELRPAMDRMLRATGDVAKSQELMSLALDISAGTGKSLTQVSQSLQKAYLGQTQALGRLGVGLTKAELATGDFDTIANQLTLLFQGQAASAADTYAGSMDRLQVSVNNAKETIGAGLVEALQLATGNTGADGATNAIDKLASGISDTAVNIGYLIEGLDKIKPLLIAIGAAAAIYFLPITSAIVAATLALSSLGKVLFGPKVNKNINGVDLSPSTQTMESFQKMNKIKSLADLEREKAAKKLLALEKSRLKVEADSIKAKKLQKAIDKAELALGKGTNIFDMEAIQLQAARENQVKELGKVTNTAQLLSITNDLARLEVMKSMSELEDAIASKDEAAIVRATNKLNENLKIVGALTGQELKLVDIEKILEVLVPKDLINLANLDSAIEKLKLIAAGFGTGAGGGAGGGGGTGDTGIITPKPLTPQEINKKLAEGSFVPVVAGTGGVVGGSTNAGAYAPTGFPGASGNSGSVNLTFNNNFGVVGDPNSAAELITEIVRGAVDRGTLRGT